MVKTFFIRSKKIALFFICLTLTDCSAPPQKTEPSVFYERDLQVCVNGECFSGVGVPKKAASYDIEVKARDDNDYLLFETCARWQKYEDKGSKVKYRYVPMGEIESTGDCSMDITSLNSDSRNNAWAKLVFQDTQGKYNLPAFMRCNGFEGPTAQGISICQSAAGLKQQISFPKEMLTQKSGDCVLPPSVDGKKFNFEMPKGVCIFKFKEVGFENWHLLFTVGFEQSLYRKD